MAKDELDSRYYPEGHVSLDALAESAGSETALEEFGRYRQLREEGLSLLQVEKQLRMRHVLQYLEEDDVALLVGRYVSRRTLADLAAERGVTPQAVYKRLETARKNFKEAFAEHWNCEVDVEFLFKQGHGLDIEYETFPGEAEGR